MSWNLDTAHSNISFTVRHMMISKVRGEFQKFTGTFNVDESNPSNSTVEVSIDAASISTRNEQRDGHLKSPDFLNAEKYPTIDFKSTSVKVTGDRSAVLVGDLTIRGVTHPVSIDVEFVGSAKSPFGTVGYGFNGHTTINRKTWDLTWNVALETGGVLVGDDIDVEVELELVKVAETQPAQAASGK